MQEIAMAVGARRFTGAQLYAIRAPLTIAAAYRSGRQQLFKESANLPLAVDKMNFQNPMTYVTVCIGLAQSHAIAMADRKVLGIAQCSLVREVRKDDERQSALPRGPPPNTPVHVITPMGR
jgi:hypothetical protein